MVVATGFSGIECNLALAKAGDNFVFKFLEKTSLARYTGKTKAMGHKAYMFHRAVAGLRGAGRETGSSCHPTTALLQTLQEARSLK